MRNTVTEIYILNKIQKEIRGRSVEMSVVAGSGSW